MEKAPPAASRARQRASIWARLGSGLGLRLGLAPAAEQQTGQERLQRSVTSISTAPACWRWPAQRAQLEGGLAPGLIGGQAAPDYGFEGAMLGAGFAEIDDIVLDNALGGDAAQANGAETARRAQRSAAFTAAVFPHGSPALLASEVPDRRGARLREAGYGLWAGIAAAASGPERLGGGAKPRLSRLAGGLEAAGQGGFKGLCSEMEHRRVLHSGAGGEVLMAFPLTLLLEEGGSRVEISHLEHFRKLCRPGLHWYPTHFRNKRGNGWGTGVYSKSENALAAKVTSSRSFDSAALRSG